jgi:hypothetical protein
MEKICTFDMNNEFEFFKGQKGNNCVYMEFYL